eukprot:8771690-Alexandrium_andersonii.AAC.1
MMASEARTAGDTKGASRRPTEPFVAAIVASASRCLFIALQPSDPQPAGQVFPGGLRPPPDPPKSTSGAPAS